MTETQHTRFNLDAVKYATSILPTPGPPINDPVNHPSHYTSVVPGIECIDVTEHFSFLRGNAIKYLWRAGAKGGTKQDLEKAKWYIDRELANLGD